MFKKPGVIIGIMLHDSGRQFGCCGAPDAITPNIDSLAENGVLFENHFSAGTVCIPSRAAVLTGTYMRNTRLASHYDKNVSTLPKLMKSAGYEAWRIGFAEEKEYRSVAGHLYPGGHDLSGTEVLGFDYSRTDSAKARDVAEEVRALLSERRDTPLYIAAAFSEAHSPYDLPVTQEDIDRAHLPGLLPQLPDVPPAREMLARFNKAVTEADRAVGRIVAALKEQGRYDDALIYLSADHGIDFPRAKQSCYDSGTGVPLILSGGVMAKYAGLRPRGLSSHVDIMPTLCEFAGISPSPVCSGVSQLSQIRDGAEPRDFCLSEVSYDNTDVPVRALRTAEYKYIVNFNAGHPVATGNSFTRLVGAELLTRIYAAPRPLEELYDLAADPAELENLAYRREYEPVRNALRKRLFELLAADGDEVLCANNMYSDPDGQFAVAMWYKNEDGSFVLVPRK